MKTNRLKSIVLLLVVLCLLSGCSSSAKTEAAAVEGSAVTADVSEPSALSLVTVTLEGGSGRATVVSPAEVRYENGVYTAVITWSSPNYDYMVVGGETYYPVNASGNSVFEIPVPDTECTLDVQADTVAMSTPHLIDYTLVFGGTAASSAFEAAKAEETAEVTNTSLYVPACLQPTGELELKYARQFSVATCADGSMLLTIAGQTQYLLLPEGCRRPEGLDESIISLQLPLSNVYLASSSVMDLFRQLDALDAVSMTATNADSWSIPEIADAVTRGAITYAGKYSAPDYEALLAAGCSLAVENTMVYHCPEVKEQLEVLGIPVLVEYSSYETHPLGRLEWIRLYGILTGHSAAADAFFEESCRQVEEIEALESTGKTVAFFSVSTGGYAVVRSPEDYVVKIIEMAGGSYVPDDLTASGTASTINLQMETFYAAAKDADILIYNGTIEGAMYDTAELDRKSPLFSEFKAVQTGNVWCTELSVFQESTGAAGMIADLHAILSGGAVDGNLTYFHKLS